MVYCKYLVKAPDKERMTPMSRKSSLKKKLAVALSVVNALNSVAPMAIPYVNMTKNVSTKGGDRNTELVEGAFPFGGAWPMRRTKAQACFRMETPQRRS